MTDLKLKKNRDFYALSRPDLATESCICTTAPTWRPESSGAVFGL